MKWLIATATTPIFICGFIMQIIRIVFQAGWEAAGRAMDNWFLGGGK